MWTLATLDNLLSRMLREIDVHPVAYRTGPYELDPETNVLRGPEGASPLHGHARTIAERLMRTPGETVTITDLASTLYIDPGDGRTAHAEDAVRRAIFRLRWSFHRLGDRGRTMLRTVSGVGYAVEELPPAQPRALVSPLKEDVGSYL